MASTIVAQGTDTIDATGNALRYIWGQCTRLVAELFSWIPSGLGDAGDWLTNARAQGLQTGTTPAPGAVAVWGRQSGMPFGHVAAVQRLIPGGIEVAEENWLGSNRTDVRDVTGSDLAGISGFIYPPDSNLSDVPVVGGALGAAGDIGSGLSGLADALNPAKALGNLSQAITGKSNLGDFLLRAALIIFGLFLLFLALFVLVQSNRDIQEREGTIAGAAAKSA